MLYVFKLICVAAVTIPAALVIILVGLFDPYGKRVYGLSRLWSRAILAIAGVSVKVQGLDHLDPQRQYVFMANHQSNLDIPVLVQSLTEFQLRWLAKRELLRVPFFGWAIWAAKHVIVDRADRTAALETFNQAKNLMSGGISLMIFPEGTRSADGRLLPFKRGGFLLASRTQTSIVPITINGSGAVLSRGDWRLRGGTAVEVSIHPPLPASTAGAGRVKALSDHVRQAIAQNLSAAGDAAPRSRSQAATGA